MSESYLEIQLDQQPIELCKLLKIANLVAGGGEAKVVISEGYVLLNGEVEYQKRKKVYHNDVVEFNGETIQVIINENLADNLTDDSVEHSTKSIVPEITHAQDALTKASSKTSKSEINKSTKKAAPTFEDAARSSKRKPISF